MTGDARVAPSDVGPLLAVGGLAAGILAGERAGAGHASAPLALGVLALLGAWYVAGPLRLAVAVVALAMLGAAVTCRALDGLERSSLAAPVAAHERIVAKGRLLTDPDGPRFVADALLRVETFVPVAGGAARRARRTVVLRASGADAGRLRVLAAGDDVEVEGDLQPLGPRDRRFRTRHAVGELRMRGLLAFAPPRAPHLVVAARIRSVLLRGLRPLPARERGLLGGFLLGDTRDVPQGVVVDFRASGLTHLLAVSGANVAFVLALVGPLLRRLGLRGRFVGGLAVLLVFATATRFEPSVLRAGAMAAIAMAATLLGRPVAAPRLLALAVIALLLVDPFLLRSVGFQLSAGASAGIVLVARPLGERLAGPSWLREPLAVTVAAQVGVAPVLLTTFGGMPLVTPLANLLAVPVAEPLTVYGLLAAAVAGLLGRAAPPLATAVLVPARLMVDWVAGVAHATAGRGGTLGTRAAAGVVALGAAWSAVRRIGRRRGTAGGEPTPTPAPRAAPGGRADDG